MKVSDKKALRSGLATTLALCLLLTVSQMSIATSAPAKATSDSNSQPISPFPIFGMELSQILPGSDPALVKGAGALWVRRAGISWRAIEPEQGQRNWDAVANLEAEFRVAAEQGLVLIVVVRETPPWAQQMAGHSCGPVRQDKLGAFGAFMKDLVARYPSVRFWEIWNEPDIDPRLVPADSLWGCWGNQSDPYYGGGYYAEMLKAVYPQMKQAQPGAQVLVGGLLLDCDPRNPPAGKNCRPSRFLEGILRAGGGDFFDGVAFHAYDYYENPRRGDYYHPGWRASATKTGPVVSVKAQFLRELLNQYGQPGKYLLNTEMALLCGRSGREARCRTQTFIDTKSAYVVQSYLASLSQGLTASIWYSLGGWRGSGLLDGRRQPNTAYVAYQVMTQQFAGATSLQELSLGAGVRGYELSKADGKLWVLWTPNGAQRTLKLPGTPRAIADIYGQAIQGDGSVRANAMPIYVQW